MSSPPFHEEYIGTWQALLEREGIFYEDHKKKNKKDDEKNGGEWLFRGMHCSGWPLKTSLERTCETQGNNNLCKGETQGNSNLRKAAKSKIFLPANFDGGIITTGSEFLIQTESSGYP